MSRENLTSQGIFIHVGYPKCASSTLNEHLFAKHSDINDLQGKVKDVSTDLERFYHNLVLLDSVGYRHSDNKQLFEEKVKPTYLNSQPVQMFAQANLTASWHGDLLVKAERLNEVLPSAKVMIMIRNQHDFLRSLYKHYVKKCIRRKTTCIPLQPHATSELLSFEDWLQAIVDNRESGILDGIQYGTLVDIYANLFGAQNVGVFLFEELAENVESFSEKISSFLGIDAEETYQCLTAGRANVSPHYSKRFIRLRNIKNNVAPSLHLPKRISKPLLKMVSGGERWDVNFSDEWHEFLSDQYSATNTSLNNKYQLGLERYGYPLQ